MMISSGILAGLIPTLGSIDDLDHRQHHRHFHQHTDHGGERGAGIETEQHDSRGNCEFEKVTRTDQGRGRSHAMGDPEPAVQQVGQTGVEVDLDQDRHREHHDDQRLAEDLLTLETE